MSQSMHPVDDLFHRLWTKAVGSDDYVKAEWKEMGEVIMDHCYPRTEPPPETLDHPPVVVAQPDAPLDGLFETVAAIERWKGQGARHLKRGTRYTVDGAAVMSISGSIADYDHVVLILYRDDETGRPWARPVVEFLDGRYEHELPGPTE